MPPTVQEMIQQKNEEIKDLKSKLRQLAETNEYLRQQVHLERTDKPMPVLDKEIY